MGVIKSKNLAMPDLMGKPGISEGVYRLYDENGITIDYDYWTGEFTINGTASKTGSILRFPQSIVGNYNISYYYISGQIASGYLEFSRKSGAPGLSIGSTSYMRDWNETREFTMPNANQLDFTAYADSNYIDLTFKLQLEKAGGNYKLDNKVPELNNHTLREVFEGGNLVINGDFDNGTSNFTHILATGNVTNGVYSFTANEQFGRIEQAIDIPINNLCYIVSKVKTNSNQVNILLWTTKLATFGGFGEYEIKSAIEISPSLSNKMYPQVRDDGESQWSQIDVDYIYAYNLSSLGLSSLTKEQMDYWFSVYTTLLSTPNPYTKPFPQLKTTQVKQYIASKNLAMPDLMGKPEISAGVYRLINQNGITIDYEVNTGIYIINGTVTDNFSHNLTNNIIHGMLTAQLIYISGSVSTYSDGWRFANNETGSGRIYWNGFDSYEKTELKENTTLSNLFVNFITSSSFDNFTFKLQLEQGSTATEYELPFEPYFAKIKKVVLPPKNLAMPNLTGKEYLGDGVYRIYNKGISEIKYNVKSGEFHSKTKDVGSGGSGVVQNFRVELGTYTLSVNTDNKDQSFYIATLDENGNYDTAIYANQFSGGKHFEFVLENITGVALYSYETNSTETKFIIQLEKGSEATDYEKPRNTITYKPDFNMEVI